jgi:predicted Zn-dependent protease with MMP-like domain/Tfp pilus assembly protein PilF
MPDADIDALLDKAFEALWQGELEDARRLLDEARQIDSKDREVLLLEVDLFEAEGAGEEAVAAIEEALKLYEDDLALTFRYATLLLDIYDDVPGARPMLERVRERLKKGERPVGTNRVEGAANDNDEEHDFVEELLLDVLLSLSDCRAADHDPMGALDAAEEAVQLVPDDAMARLARAAALFDLCRLEEAEKAVAQALDREPRLADAYWLRGRLLTVRGDEKGATRALERAVSIEPERFFTPFKVSEDDFARVMEESLAALPDQVRAYLKNVVICVEDLPDMERLRLSDPPLSPGCLGLYEGTPPALASGDDPWAHFPNHITLFRKNIELSAGTEEDLHEAIATTLLHEVGHYLGLDEDDLDERGLG